MPDDYRRVAPPKHVDVHHNDRWWPGQLTAWIRFHDGTWRGMCAWNETPGMNYGTAVHPDDLRAHLAG